LGVIAKRGENKSYFFAVNNIVTTDPVCGKIDLYSYQQQKLATANTDASERPISNSTNSRISPW
jgi:hypothetical protein